MKARSWTWSLCSSYTQQSDQAALPRPSNKKLKFILRVIHFTWNYMCYNHHIQNVFQGKSQLYKCITSFAKSSLLNPFDPSFVKNLNNKFFTSSANIILKFSYQATQIICEKLILPLHLIFSYQATQIIYEKLIWPLHLIFSYQATQIIFENKSYLCISTNCTISLSACLQKLIFVNKIYLWTIYICEKMYLWTKYICEEYILVKKIYW